MQKILVIGTRRPTLRDSTVVGHFVENPEGQDFNAPPEKWTPAPIEKKFRCVLEAMAEGWTLLGPPTKQGWYSTDGLNTSDWAWWLAKEEETGKKKK